MDDELWENPITHKRKSKRVKREYTSSPSLADSEDANEIDDLPLRQATLFLQSARTFPSSQLLETEADSVGFEATSSLLMDDFRDTRHRAETAAAVRNDHGHLVRLLSRLEKDQLLWDIAQKQSSSASTASENILFRRLNYQTQKILRPEHTPEQIPFSKPLPPTTDIPSPSSDILDGLYSIKSTPFETSFASRLYEGLSSPATVFFEDWETMSPWMELMADLMDHYRISHPGHEIDKYNWAPITYTPIYAHHLSQVHDLLERSFWPGIDVSDSVKWEPKQCSVVALYKQLVVGCAFLSETMDPYVTYITVRAGWESAGIATFMLYHLIKTNPNHDISLHVSATNPAMLLYNKFGFKAEEFVVGFYDDYLDSQTRLCKNALRLRYRR
ncbi:hypothetical protein BDV93DRAFT_521165 [Ceratobasidium sp. AG-I]|nr:hypothetical protein BDV93DRAFT_521165 [Ceratobasidium sp. AG-I]